MFPAAEIKWGQPSRIAVGCNPEDGEKRVDESGGAAPYRAAVGPYDGRPPPAAGAVLISPDAAVLLMGFESRTGAGGRPGTGAATRRAAGRGRLGGRVLWDGNRRRARDRK